LNPSKPFSDDPSDVEREIEANHMRERGVENDRDDKSLTETVEDAIRPITNALARDPKSPDELDEARRENDEAQSPA